MFGRAAPRKGYAAGYGWLIQEYALAVPPPQRLALIDGKRGRRSEGDWLLFDDPYRPEDDPYEHLVFALKYEGIDLHLIKVLCELLGSERIAGMIRREPTGQYARRLWFLCEWLLDTVLDIPDLGTRDYYDLVDPDLQYPGPPRNSRRHGIRNNLPGTVDFCPLIHRTEMLDNCIAMDLSSKIRGETRDVPSDLLLRAAAFLMLADSRASFAIEGEKPTIGHAQRWAAAIGQAGRAPITRTELERLQQLMIPRPAFSMGYRTGEGFIGDRDRLTHEPLPEHISAKAEDLERLMGGLEETATMLEAADMDAVIAAVGIAFGFVFIHPFVDGNGRLHRWLIHHMLAAKGFSDEGLIFPVSSIMLERIDEYRRVLQSFSLPRLNLIEWSPDEHYNVHIHNDTIDLYRYFDATALAEFLYDCVRQTVESTLPAEIAILRRHDAMKSWLEEHFEFSDSTDTLLISFLEQGNGTLSARARKKEFSFIPTDDIERIEEAYRKISADDT